MDFVENQIWRLSCIRTLECQTKNVGYVDLLLDHLAFGAESASIACNACNVSVRIFQQSHRKGVRGQNKRNIYIYI